MKNLFGRLFNSLRFKLTYPVLFKNEKSFKERWLGFIYINKTKARGLSDIWWKIFVIMSIKSIIDHHLFLIIKSEGASMWPIIGEDYDTLWLDILGPSLFGYKRGDIVVSKNPLDNNSWVCKRICAMGGDNIKIIDQKGEVKDINVPQGFVILLGENLDKSLDSRFYGLVSERMIRGKLLFKMWPIWEIKSVYAMDGPEPHLNLLKRAIEKDF